MYITQEKRNYLRIHLYSIRRILKLTAEDLGLYLGLTRQTIVCIEECKNKIKNIHYIALLVILQYEYNNKKAELTTDDRAYVGAILRDLVKDIPYLKAEI